MTDLPCYHCDNDIPVPDGWGPLGEEFKCPTCKRMNLVADNYIMPGHHQFYMEKPDE